MRCAGSALGQGTAAEVSYKQGGSPVTEADLAVDTFLKNWLGAVAPAYGWLSEETLDDSTRLTRPIAWVVDPIDGTRAFARGDADWTVAIGIVADEVPVAGFVFAPVSDEMFEMTPGDVSRRNGEPISPTGRDTLVDAFVAGPRPLLDQLGGGLPLSGLPHPFAGLRPPGGRPGTVDAGLAGERAHDWDLAAAHAILTGAGRRWSEPRDRCRPTTARRPCTSHWPPPASGWPGILRPVLLHQEDTANPPNRDSKDHSMATPSKRSRTSSSAANSSSSTGPSSGICRSSTSWASSPTTPRPTPPGNRRPSPQWTMRTCATSWCICTCSIPTPTRRPDRSLSMLKRIGRSAPVQAALGNLLAGYLRLVGRTSRLVLEPPDLFDRLDPQKPFICALWHGQHFMIPLGKRPQDRYAVLISRHGDGGINAAACDSFGIRPIRASAGAPSKMHKRGGVYGLREMLRALEQGDSVTLTADVPKTARVAGMGIVTLARLSGRPIVPVTVVEPAAQDIRQLGPAIRN